MIIMILSTKVTQRMKYPTEILVLLITYCSILRYIPKENDDLLHNKKCSPLKITVKYPIFRFLIHPATFHDIKLKLVNVNFWEIALYVYLPRVTKMCQEGIHKISCG